MKKIKIINANEIVYYEKLKNGLDVYIWPSKNGEDIHMSLTVKYGSIHTEFETNNKKVIVPNGIAHFLEHVKFNEDKDMTAHEYFNKLGSYVNAYTTYDHTSYEVVCTSNFEDNLKHLLFFVNNNYFTKALIEKEKPIIVEETKMVLDNPYNIGYKALFENLYFNDKKKNLVTGNIKDVKSITLNDVETVFNTFYIPNNMFLIVTGNVCPKEVIRILKSYYNGDNGLKKNKFKHIKNKEIDDVKKDIEIKKCAVARKKLLLAYKINKKQFGYDDIVLKILFTIILNSNFGSTSIFNENLTKNELIEDMTYMVSVEESHVIITFEVSSDYPEKVSLLIKEKMRDLMVSKEEFIRKNKIYIASTILGYDDADEVASDIRYDLINYGKIVNNINPILNKLNYKMLERLIASIKKYAITEVILDPIDK